MVNKLSYKLRHFHGLIAGSMEAKQLEDDLEAALLERDALKAEVHGWEVYVGKLLGSLPLGDVIPASSSLKDFSDRLGKMVTENYSLRNEVAALKAELEAARKQEPCGYMCEDAGITTIYNAAKCTGDFSNYIPVYKNPILSQQETSNKMTLIMEIVEQIVSDYRQLRSHELGEGIKKAEQLLKGGENER